jgi:hypothetical protein
MQETIQALRGLQELDGDLYRVNRELERLPLERDRRRVAMENKASELVGLAKQLLEKRMRVKEIEDVVRTDRQRIRKLEGEIQSARDGALVAAYQHEARSLKRSIGEADEEGLGFLEQIEALESERARIESELETERAEFEEYSANVDTELAGARAKRAELLAGRRGALSLALEPEVLNRYERLIEAREGVALAALESRICQGCYMEVPSNVFVKLARSTELVTCPSCDRILYLVP